VVGVAISLAWDPAAGIVAGGLIGPLVGMAVPAGGREHVYESILPFETTRRGPDARPATNVEVGPAPEAEPEAEPRSERGLP
jgi:hypothetical protein